MDTVRVNISLPKRVADALAEAAPPRHRSRFVCQAIEALLQEREAQQLAAEYREAAAEIRSMNLELEGTLGDGLD